MDFGSETFILSDADEESTSWDYQRMRIHDSSGIAPTLSTSDGKGGQRTPIVFQNQSQSVIPPLRAGGGVTSNPSMKDNLTDLDFLIFHNPQQDGSVRVQDDGNTPTVSQHWGTGGNNTPMIVGSLDSGGSGSPKAHGGAWPGTTVQSASAGHSWPTEKGVRRLTPVECARLQGFPDNWNDFLSDSARYRQFGNAIAVPVVRWIGERLKNALNT